MDFQGTVLQLIATAAPAIILYFTGWSYLYFYLESFQINISEVNIDVPTVFVYAYPPLYTLWESYSVTIIVVVAAAAALLIAGKPVWRWLGGRVPPLAWTIVLLFTLVFCLPFPLARLTEWAAAHAANKVWEGQTVELDPVLKGEETTPTTAPLQSAAQQLTPPEGHSSPGDNEEARLIANLSACMKSGELGLIFSVEEHYYLLCQAVDAPDTGNVFEVTGKEGLISVRESVYRRRWRGR